jgi:hypothetical protein
VRYKRPLDICRAILNIAARETALSLPQYCMQEAGRVMQLNQLRKRGGDKLNVRLASGDGLPLNL